MTPLDLGRFAARLSASFTRPCHVSTLRFIGVFVLRVPLLRTRMRKEAETLQELLHAAPADRVMECLMSSGS